MALIANAAVTQLIFHKEKQNLQPLSPTTHSI